MTSHTKLVAGTIAVAALAAGGAGFAAVELTSSSNGPYAPLVTTPFGRGIAGSGLGGGALGGRGFGGGLGPGSGGGRFRVTPGGPAGGGFFGGQTSSAATYLGISPMALRADLRKGETLAEVAKAQGKSVDLLVAAMIAAEKTRLETAVTNGVLTPAQAAQIESTMQLRVTAIVNGTRPQGFQGFGGGYGHSGAPTTGQTA
jgi:hypothetical protein